MRTHWIIHLGSVDSGLWSLRVAVELHSCRRTPFNFGDLRRSWNPTSLTPLPQPWLGAWGLGLDADSESNWGCGDVTPHYPCTTLTRTWICWIAMIQLLGASVSHVCAPECHPGGYCYSFMRFFAIWRWSWLVPPALGGPGVWIGHGSVGGWE